MRNFFLTCGLVLFACSPAAAHSDQLGRLVHIVKTYQAEEPVGRITLEYDGRDADAAVIRVESALFRAEVPPAALENLPRPDYEHMDAPYSTISFDGASGEWVARPYLYVSVSVLGPAGESWPSTWVHFQFDDRGRLTHRRLKRFVPQPSNSIRVLMADWPVGSDQSAAEVLAAEEAKR